MAEVIGCRLLVPDGSLKDVVAKLLADAGMPISYPDGERSYRGLIRHERLFPPPFNVVRRLRPWDAPWIVADGKAELAFSGEDLIAEAGCENKVVVIGRYPLSRAGVGCTRLVVAVPPDSEIKRLSDLKPEHELVTEYPNLARRWLEENGVSPRIRACHGSLEAFADIADAIFETVESGVSLKVAGFTVISTVMESWACLITNYETWNDPDKRAVIDQFKLLLDSVINGRGKSLLKCNVVRGQVTLSQVLAILPAANAPTVSNLAGEQGFAIETVVATNQVPDLIVALKAIGASSVIDLPIGRYAE
jgi:ATP phosphoribosyltransferase